MRRDIQDDLITDGRQRARGDGRCTRGRVSQDGRWRVDTLPWVSVTATGRREALDEAREVIAEWLDVPPDAFDVEAS